MKLLTSLFVILLSGIFVLSFGQNNTDPKLIGDPFFELPEEAAAAGIEGRIVVSMKVDKDGKPESVEVVAGPEWPCKSNPRRELEAVRKAAKDYALGLKFVPATEDGKPASAKLLVTISTGRALDQLKRHSKASENVPTGRPFFIRAGVVNGKALSLPKPEYPRNARGSSVVRVAVLVGEDGNVERAGAYSGHPSLHESARDAACKARFQPTTLQGSPIKVYGSLTYNFVGPRP